MLQMAVTGTIKSYFVVLNPHGMIIDEIYFDNECFYLDTSLFGIKTFEA